MDEITRLRVEEQTWGQTHVTSLVRPLDYELELLPQSTTVSLKEVGLPRQL